MKRRDVMLLAQLVVLATPARAVADAGPAPVVEGLGSQSCPTATMLREKLEATVRDARKALVVRVAIETGSLHVSAFWSSGATIANRTVATPVRCDDRAELIASLVAAWLADERPAADLLYPESPAQPSVPPPPPPVLEAAPAIVSQPRSARWRAEAALGVTLLAPLDVGAAATPGLALEVTLGRTEGAWALVGAVGVSGERRIALSPGHAQLRYGDVRIGGLRRLAGGPGGLELSFLGGGGLTITGAEGTGFTAKRSSAGWTPSLWTGLRAAAPQVGPARLFLSGVILERLRTQVVATTLPESSRELPRTEIQVTLGVAFGRARSEGL